MIFYRTLYNGKIIVHIKKDSKKELCSECNAELKYEEDHVWTEEWKIYNELPEGFISCKNVPKEVLIEKCHVLLSDGDTI